MHFLAEFYIFQKFLTELSKAQEMQELLLRGFIWDR